MRLLQTVSEAWGWTGVRPRSIAGQNSFGNLLVEDENGAYWRICPEQLSCTLIADGIDQFLRLTEDQEFQDDWQMSGLTTDAIATLGQLQSGRCFCLKMPAILGGEYAMSNIGEIGLEELVRFSGDVAFQVKDLPAGTKVRIKIVD